MEDYLFLVAGLFVWAAVVFFVVEYNDWSDLVAALATLLGYAFLAESFGVAVVTPGSGELIGRLLEFTFTYYGVVGLVALVGGAALGKSTGARQRLRG